MLNEAGLALGASVLMHVTWNLIARQQPRNAFALWWALAAHLLLLAPWGFSALLREVQWTPAFAALLATSATANVLYFVGLRRAYAHAPVALVYPLVRSSPLLIALWSTWLLGETLSVMSWLGIALSVAGLGLMAGGQRGGNDGRAILWALLAMFSTSIYSLSDRAASASIGSFAGLVGFISVGYGLAWLVMSIELYRETGRCLPRQRIAWPALLAGGLSIGLAYALVIHAMRFMPAAEAVAYSNAGIILASLISIFVFAERQAWRRRLSGALIICAGLLVMRL